MSNALRSLSLRCASLLFGCALAAGAQTTETYELNDVWLDAGGAPRQMTGSFQWTYTPGEFENGTGVFTEVSIPWYDPGLENLEVTMEPGQIEFSLLGNWHDLGCDISIFFEPAFGPGQSGLVDTTRSAFDIQYGVSHQGVIVSGSADPQAGWSASCFGDGSSADCPCDNVGAAGEGCANSSGAGATLSGAGSASVGADDLQLLLAGGPGVTAALLFSGTTQVAGGDGLAFGDGLRCAGGNVARLGVRLSDAAGAATWGPGLASAGAWTAGETRYLQVWYRDVNGSPCGNAFNLTNGVGLSLVQ